jgi:hypothetical protein
MSDHAHTWEPLQGHTALYLCACGTVGKRDIARCGIHALKTKRVPRESTVGFLHGVSTQKANAFMEENFNGWADFGSRY